MAASLEHISNKMMGMDIDKVGAQSLGLSLIPAVPDKFLIKYNPPKIWVVYHFKDHNEKDQYWRDIPLEVNTGSTANSVTDFLFKEHCYYFDSSLIGKQQVNKLVDMILKKNGNEEAKQPDNKGSLVDNLTDAFSKPNKSNRLFGDIQKARDLDSGIGSNLPKKGALEPLNHPPKGKLEPLGKKPEPANDGFDLLDLDDLTNPNPPQEQKKKEEPKASDKIEDEYDFDFGFDTPAEADGSKVPPPKAETQEKSPAKDIKEKKETKASIDMEKFEKEKEKSNQQEKGKDEEDDWLIIEGKRYREINIEGDDNEYIMDEEGNIYDLKGVYIGTAKDGGEESEEEDEK